MMTLNDEMQFRNADRQVPSGTVVRLMPTADERSLAMTEFCERVAKLLPHVSIARDEDAEKVYPSMLLPNGVHYRGIPTGTEVPPFIQALTGRIPPLGARLGARLAAGSPAPAGVDLFVAPQCTFCPDAVRRVMPLAAASRLIRVTVIDAILFPEIARHHGVQAVPTLVLDGSFRWTGAIVLEEVVDLLVARDPVLMGPAALEMLLKEGAARRLARMMADRNQVFPALIDLLCHEQWPVRLGAMVVVEELSAMAPDLGREAIDALWSRFESAGDQVKGDILFLCGEVGSPQVVPRIAAVLQRGVPAEVKEAAEEALAKLE